MRSDPGIFNFVKWLRVGKEACPTLEQAKALYPSKPGWPDTMLVISHSKRMAVNAAANRALAPEASKLLELETQVIHIDLGCQTYCNTKQPAEHEGVAGAAPHRGRREDTQGGLCGRGGSGAGRSELDNGMRLKNQELLRATRPSHAVTYLESCHLTLRHLYVGASRAMEAA